MLPEFEGKSQRASWPRSAGEQVRWPHLSALAGYPMGPEFVMAQAAAPDARSRSVSMHTQHMHPQSAFQSPQEQVFINPLRMREREFAARARAGTVVAGASSPKHRAPGLSAVVGAALDSHDPSDADVAEVLLSLRQARPGL